MKKSMNKRNNKHKVYWFVKKECEICGGSYDKAHKTRHFNSNKHKYAEKYKQIVALQNKIRAELNRYIKADDTLKQYLKNNNILYNIKEFMTILQQIKSNLNTKQKNIKTMRKKLHL